MSKGKEGDGFNMRDWSRPEYISLDEHSRHPKFRGEKSFFFGCAPHAKCRNTRQIIPRLRYLLQVVTLQFSGRNTDDGDGGELYDSNSNLRPIHFDSLAWINWINFQLKIVAQRVTLTARFHMLAVCCYDARTLLLLHAKSISYASPPPPPCTPKAFLLVFLMLFWVMICVFMGKKITLNWGWVRTLGVGANKGKPWAMHSRVLHTLSD